MQTVPISSILFSEMKFQNFNLITRNIAFECLIRHVEYNTILSYHSMTCLIHTSITLLVGH